MEVKEMREVLKTMVETVPRSNENVIAMYDTLMPGNVDVPRETQIDAGDMYTYIGAGDTPPHMVKFMGLQVFVRGTPTRVTNPEVLAKVKVHRCFVKGKADMEKVYANDEIEAQKAQSQRERDQATQIMVDRQNRKG